MKAVVSDKIEIEFRDKFKLLANKNNSADHESDQWNKTHNLFCVIFLLSKQLSIGSLLDEMGS